MNQVAATWFDRISRLQTTFTQPHLQFRTQTAFSDYILKLPFQKQKLALWSHERVKFSYYTR